ncbi:C-type lectin domain family 7 member A-like [Alligator sinensis]|uniref:C-type lectin domain family 7 member A-like n=1 Tax=Alligator sinensis TaxID=38654 RepID=A0A3Q0FPR1_ALLSI|nr:C-type lectin domain family 7 member A-like [Alligator sinensis]
MLMPSVCKPQRASKAPLEMREHMITYSDLKLDSSKHGDKVRQKEMTTYSELKFQNQTEQQRGRRFQEAGSRGAGGSPSPSRRNKAPPHRQQCATVILGILCLVLLIATGVLSYCVLDMKLSPGKGSSSELSPSCPDQQPGLPKIPDEHPGDTGQKCPARWTTAEGRSYLFSPEKGTWEHCKSSCMFQSARLLNIENRKELDFIKQELYQYYEDRQSVTWYYPFWIGLSYYPGSRKWVWEDNTDLSSGLFDLQDLSHQNDQGRVCVYVQGGKAKPGACGETHFCICEKEKK